MGSVSDWQAVMPRNSAYGSSCDLQRQQTEAAANTRRPMPMPLSQQPSSSGNKRTPWVWRHCPLLLHRRLAAAPPFWLPARPSCRAACSAGWCPRHCNLRSRGCSGQNASAAGQPAAAWSAAARVLAAAAAPPGVRACRRAELGWSMPLKALLLLLLLLLLLSVRVSVHWPKWRLLGGLLSGLSSGLSARLGCSAAMHTNQPTQHRQHQTTQTAACAAASGVGEGRNCNLHSHSHGALHSL